MSKQSTYKEFCNQYQLELDDPKSKAAYEKYCENLEFVNSVIADTTTKEIISKLTHPEKREYAKGKNKYERLTGLEFGREMLKWQAQGVMPFEMITFFRGKDDRGIFFMPCLELFGSGKMVITGVRDGYSTRQSLLNEVGRCWDLAEAKLPK